MKTPGRLFCSQALIGCLLLLVPCLISRSLSAPRALAARTLAGRRSTRPAADSPTWPVLLAGDFERGIYAPLVCR